MNTTIFIPAAETFDYNGKQTKGVFEGVCIEDIDRKTLEDLLVHVVLSQQEQAVEPTT